MAFLKHIDTLEHSIMTNTFNPAKFVRTAQDTYNDYVAYQKFLAENKHLAAPFFIEGLENILPRFYPGNLTAIVAKSHHGKSTLMRQAVHQAQRRVENSEYMVAYISLEDSSETIAAKLAVRHENPVHYMAGQMIYIGNSFNMSAEDMGELNVGNIIRALEWTLDEFPKKSGFSAIFIDYIQIVPPDPERRRMVNMEQRRLQIADDVKRLFHAAKQFKCPVFFASQALIKGAKDTHSLMMRIPNAADLKEASDLFEVPDVVISIMQPKHEPGFGIGTRVDDGAWSFVVEPNLMFLKILKWRNAELQGFVGEKDVIGRIFPCFIEPNGRIYYDAERHRRMVMKPLPSEIAEISERE
jgi:hypothetical protein